MINTRLLLKIGELKRGGKLSVHDTVDFEIQDYKSDVSCDSINDWLVYQSFDASNYAELRVHFSGIKHDGFLIGTFKKIKMKSGKTRWIVAD